MKCEIKFLVKSYLGSNYTGSFECVKLGKETVFELKIVLLKFFNLKFSHFLLIFAFINMVFQNIFFLL